MTQREKIVNEPPQRKGKKQRKVYKPEIEHVEGTEATYTVSSSSEEGKIYRVDVSDPVYCVCTCEAGKHGILCRHVKAAWATHYMEGQNRQRSSETPDGIMRVNLGNRKESKGN